MKFNTGVTSKPGKVRRAQYNTSAIEKRDQMKAPLSKDLRKQYNVRSVPVCRGDTVMIISGKRAKTEGVVEAVYRKKSVLHIRHATRESCRGEKKSVGIRACKCVITKLSNRFLNQRKAVLARKNRENLPARQPLNATMSE